METIKLLHISETFVSGVYTYIKQICNHLEHNSLFEVYVIYSSEREETNLLNLAQDFPSNVHLINIPMSREISLEKDFSSLINLRREIKKIQPDIIHLHSSKSGIIGRFASLGVKAKKYYTPHGYSFIRQDISKNKKKIYFLIELFSNTISPVVTIACGDSEFDLAKKIDSKAICIRNGVDTENIHLAFKPQTNKKPIIGTSGRISTQKNPKLFNEIASKFPQYDFIWIGDGDLTNDLTAKNITITGWKSHKETLDITNSFDIFLSTSSWEGLPFNIIEAMALSKPIISKNIDGNRVTIDNGENGFLCDSIKEFETAIPLVLSNTAAFGNKSFNLANSLFNINENLKSLINEYTK